MTIKIGDDSNDNALLCPKCDGEYLQLNGSAAWSHCLGDSGNDILVVPMKCEGCSEKLFLTLQQTKVEHL
jgi:hypothetical protein